MNEHYASRSRRVVFTWSAFVFRRLFFPRAGSNRSLLYLSILGVCIGVFALICVIGVMNGIQINYIENILEQNSYHIQIEPVSPETQAALLAYQNPEIRSITPFTDMQVLISSVFAYPYPYKIRAIPRQEQPGHIQMLSGTFDIEQGIVLPRSFAYSAGIFVGDYIDIMALPENPDAPLMNTRLIVSGLFASNASGYGDELGYLSLAKAKQMTGNELPSLGIKLHNRNKEIQVIADITTQFQNISAHSWRKLNWSLFAALRIEKLTIVLLLCIIFIIVGVNVFQSFKRNVIKRKRDIAILCFLGGSNEHICNIFIYAGFVTGIVGSIVGLSLGLLVINNISTIFVILGRITQYWQNTAIVDNLESYWYLDTQALVSYFDVLGVVLFATAAIVFAAYRASRIRVQQDMILRMM